MEKTEKIYFLILLLVFVILIIALVGYIILNKKDNNKKTNLTNNNEIVSLSNTELKKISTFETGDVIKFSGKEWVVINKTDTAVGVILKDFLPSRKFCADMEKRYSLTDEESLLYYLNEYFLKTLEEEKIIDYNWKAVSNINGEDIMINAKVGLLTKSEFLHLEMSGISEKFKIEDAWWLLDTSKGDFLRDSMIIVTMDEQTNVGWIEGTYAVKPVIYILNDTEV